MASSPADPVARRASRRGTRGPSWLLGALIALLLIGHDTGMAIAPRHASAAASPAVPSIEPVADVAATHDHHASAGGGREGDSAPAGQPCFTTRSGVAPLGTDAPAQPATAPLDGVHASWLAPVPPDPSTGPPLSPAVRRALLQVYLN